LYNPQMLDGSTTAAAEATGGTGNLPSIRVVIPVRNAETTLRACLRSVIECDYPRKSVWVVNDGSDDATATILGEFPEIKVLHVKAIGASAARNLAISSADEDIIAFTDSDCVVRRDWLRELVACLMETGVTGAGGPQLPVQEQPIFARRLHAFLAAICFVGDYMRVGHGKHPVQHIPSCNAAYWRRAVQSIGGFRPGLFPGEDMDLDRRLVLAGHRIIYTPAAVVCHHRAETMGEYVRMSVGYGLAQGYLVRIHGPFRMLHVLPAIAAIGGLGWAWLMAASPAIGIAVALAAALMILSFLAGRVHPPLDIGWLMLLLLITVPTWNAGFLLGLVVGFRNPVTGSGWGNAENEDTAHQRP